MASRHIIACGGVKPLESTNGDSADRIAFDLRDEGNVSLHIEDIHARLFREVPDVFQDLVEIATYVFCADQAYARGGMDEDSFGGSWRRDFEFHIPVRCLDFWNSNEVSAALRETVEFLTDDFFSFSFYAAQKAPNFQRYLTLPVVDCPRGEPQQVMMFSGGMDSLAGAVQEALVDRKCVLLVNHKSTDKLNRKHAELLSELKKKAGAFMPGHLRVRVHKDSALTKDYHQRSRSLLYAALGGTVARMVGLKSLRFYENGVVAQNLPVCAQVVGSRATRTAHPRVLAGFQKLLSLMTGDRFEVSNPFQFVTRGETIKLIMKAGCGDLVEPSTSCGHTRMLSTEHTHCGVCSQCIDRRIGVIAAGAEQYDSVHHYLKDAFTESLPKDMDKLMIATFLERANSIKGVSTDAQFIALYPQVLDILPYIEGGAGSVLARVLDLYRRHAGEVNLAMDEMVSRYRVAIRERTLPGDCMLRIVYESGSVTSIPTAGEPTKSEAPRVLTEEDSAGNKIQVIRDGESIMYDGKTYQFSGKCRWEYVNKLVAAKGAFVPCGKNLKSYFAKDKEAKAFFDAAIEPEGLGRNGTGRYRLKM